MGLLGRGRSKDGAAPLANKDAVLADLDGVVYKGAHAISHAVESLRRAATEGRRVGYITNNASRTDEQVAEQLRGFGLSVRADDVVTSPQAAVRLLAEQVPAGSTILVVGGIGLVSEVEKAGFRVTSQASDKPAAVIQGFAPDVSWTHLAQAAFALHEGIPWVATNMDWTIPVAEGIAPGNGTLVSAVHTAVGILPVVGGKPERPIFDTAVQRFGSRSPLFIGDRLDTDIVGAVRAEIPSALVLTGIDGPKQLVAAETGSRPDYILGDLRELFDPYPEPGFSRDRTRVTVRDAEVSLEGNRVSITRRGARVDEIRAACALIWGTGQPIYALDVDSEVYAR